MSRGAPRAARAKDAPAAGVAAPWGDDPTEGRAARGRIECGERTSLFGRMKSQAELFEVSWPGGRTLVPRDPRRFWDPAQAARDDPSVILELVGPPFYAPVADETDASDLRVVALYPDGSRQPVEARGPLRWPPPLAAAPTSEPLQNVALVLVLAGISGAFWAGARLSRRR